MLTIMRLIYWWITDEIKRIEYLDEIKTMIELYDFFELIYIRKNLWSIMTLGV